jgi:hypothetical protein
MMFQAAPPLLSVSRVQQDRMLALQVRRVELDAFIV